VERVYKNQKSLITLKSLFIYYWRWSIFKGVVCENIPIQMRFPRSVCMFQNSIKVRGYSYQTGSRILLLMVLFLHCQRHKQNDQEMLQVKIVQKSRLKQVSTQRKGHKHTTMSLSQTSVPCMCS
jgi:hypothetical protein